MRDPNRIPEMLELLNELWQQDKDLRFNQLVYILQSQYSQLNGGEGKISSTTADGFTQTGFDFFNIEDDKFSDFLKRKLDSQV